MSYNLPDGCTDGFARGFVDLYCRNPNCEMFAVAQRFATFREFGHWFASGDLWCSECGQDCGDEPVEDECDDE